MFLHRLRFLRIRLRLRKWKSKQKSENECSDGSQTMWRVSWKRRSPETIFVSTCISSPVGERKSKSTEKFLVKVDETSYSCQRSLAGPVIDTSKLSEPYYLLNIFLRVLTEVSWHDLFSRFFYTLAIQSSDSIVQSSSIFATENVRLYRGSIYEEFKFVKNVVCVIHEYWQLLYYIFFIVWVIVIYFSSF